MDVRRSFQTGKRAGYFKLFSKRPARIWLCVRTPAGCMADNKQHQIYRIASYKYGKPELAKENF